MVERAARLDLDLDHPALAIRVGGDAGGVVDELFVDGDHFAVDGGIDVADRLDRLDLAEAFPGEDVVADVGQLDVNDVGELLDGKLGDAERAGVAFEDGPLVRRRVPQVLRIHQYLLAT